MAEMSLLIIGFVLGVLVGQGGGSSGGCAQCLQRITAVHRRTNRAAA
jgi:hypothetical protein